MGNRGKPMRNYGWLFSGIPAPKATIFGDQEINERETTGMQIYLAYPGMMGLLRRLGAVRKSVDLHIVQFNRIESCFCADVL